MFLDFNIIVPFTDKFLTIYKPRFRMQDGMLEQKMKKKSKKKSQEHLTNLKHNWPFSKIGPINRKYAKLALIALSKIHPINKTD